MGSVNEIIELTETHSPFFLTRFRECYPDFIDRLSSHYPGISEDDMKLTAFIRLGLNTKEIA